MIARKRVGVFTNILNRTIPLAISLWTYGDIILDVIQTIKYRNFAHIDGIASSNRAFTISPYYYITSMLSFCIPVILCFVIVMYNVLGPYFKDVGSNHSWKMWVFFALELVIGIPCYLLASAILCYIVIPIMLLYHGLETITNGYDEEKIIDWDPCNLITKFSSSKGLLDLYGIKNVKSKSVHLLAGIEQLGEASIQTVLSLLFLVSNYDAITETDIFLGIPCPVSVISVFFSIISFFVGIAYNLFSIKKLVIEKTNDV
jgi:hypothetical protein